MKIQPETQINEVSGRRAGTALEAPAHHANRFEQAMARHSRTVLGKDSGRVAESDTTPSGETEKEEKPVVNEQTARIISRMNRTSMARKDNGGAATPHQDAYNGWTTSVDRGSSSSTRETRTEREDAPEREPRSEEERDEKKPRRDTAVDVKPLVETPQLEGEEPVALPLLAGPDAKPTVEATLTEPKFLPEQPLPTKPTLVTRDGAARAPLGSAATPNLVGDTQTPLKTETASTQLKGESAPETVLGGDLDLMADPALAKLAKRVVVRRGEQPTTTAHAPGDAVLHGLQRMAGGGEMQTTETSPVNRLAGAVEMWLARPRGEELGIRQARFEVVLPQGQTAQIQVIHDGDQLRVNLNAPNEQLRAWLQDNSSALQQRLQQRGGLNVEVRIGGQAFDGDPRDGRSRQQRDVYEELNDDGARFNKPLHMLYGKRGSQ